MVESVDISDDGRVRLAVLLTIAGCPLRDTITADSEKALSAVPGVTAVDVELKVMNQAQRDALKEQLRGAGGQRGIPFNEPGSLTKVFAVASGKGGVGSPPSPSTWPAPSQRRGSGWGSWTPTSTASRFPA